MEDKARFAVGIDVGTNFVRTVLGTVKGEEVSVIGYGEVPTEGMRRGIVKELVPPAKAIDECLTKVEGMSGIKVDRATVGINGAHIGSTKIDGMIAVGVAEHEIDEEDIMRIADTSIAGKIPANRETLALVPYEYILDGQGGIHEPLGIHGARLELRANVVTALTPDCDNLRKVCQSALVEPHGPFEPNAMAAARAVTTSAQRENGVGVLDFGGATTSLAVFDEGELQFVGVIPLGSNDITKDLATVLATVPDVAEEIKVRFASAVKTDTNEKDIMIKRGREEFHFRRKEVEEVVEARLEEIFEGVRKMLQVAGYDRRLPEGLVLCGGGAKLKNIELFARKQVELAVRVAKPAGIIGVSEDILKPEYATAIGLMLGDNERSGIDFSDKGGRTQQKHKKKGSGGFLSRFFKFFKD